MIGRAFLTWLALMVLAIANGALREAVLAPQLGPGAAHLASIAVAPPLTARGRGLLVPPSP